MDCIVVHLTLAAPLQLPEALFLKCTCIPPPPPNARASAVFRFFAFTSSSYDWRNYETAICGWRLHPYFLHGWRRKKGIPFTYKTHCINKLWVKVKMKAGIANSLSARCAGACSFARTEVRRRKRRMVGWRRSVRRFPQKWGGRREKKGRFERKSTIFHSISPDSQETKYF